MLTPSPSAPSHAVPSKLKGNPYLIIATLWAFYNSVAPYLFLHYCFTTGPSFKFMVKWTGVCSTLVMLTASIIIWLLIPQNYDASEVGRRGCACVGVAELGVGRMCMCDNVTNG